MKKGLFVVLEGLDGAGTTTQAELLAEFLRRRGETVVQTFEPTDRALGVALRTALRGQWDSESGELDPAAVALLFAADRVDHGQTRIRPSVEAGQVVLSDRYVHSSFAYQGTLLPMEWVKAVNAYAVVPDLTLYVRVPVEVAMERLNKRGTTAEIYERKAMQERVFSAYEDLFSPPQEGVFTVDGTRSADQVHAAIVERIEPLLER